MQAPRSHLGDGRVVYLDGLTRDGTAAIDAELVTRPVPPRLATRAGTRDPVAFWTRWTSWEVVAKLTGQPIVDLVHDDCLQRTPSARGVELATAVSDGVCMSAGAVG